MKKKKKRQKKAFSDVRRMLLVVRTTMDFQTGARVFSRSLGKDNSATPVKQDGGSTYSFLWFWNH